MRSLSYLIYIDAFDIALLPMDTYLTRNSLESYDQIYSYVLLPAGFYPYKYVCVWFSDGIVRIFVTGTCFHMKRISTYAQKCPLELLTVIFA